MKRILIATDGTPAARAAVERGLELALEAGAEVTFVHVLQPESSGDGAPAHAANSAALVEAAARAAAHGVASSIEYARGDPAGEILGRAEALGADLVVVGSRGRGPTVGALLGTVSSAVLRTAERAVLIVRDRARGDEAG